MYNLKKILKLIFSELIHGGHLQSLGAVSVVFVSALLLDIKINWDVLLVIYLLFYSLFLYNRFKEIDIDYLTNPERTQHFRKYVKLMPLIFYLAVFVLIGTLIYFSNILALIFTLILLGLGILYTLFFKKVTKVIWFFKDFYVAIFFALLPSFLLVYYSRFSLDINLLLLSLFILFEVILMSIFLDIKDIKSDKKEGLRTLPVMLGEKKTISFLFIYNPLMAIIMMAILLYFTTLPRLVIMLIFIVPFDLYCYFLIKKKRNVSYILQGGRLITWAFLVFLGKIIL